MIAIKILPKSSHMNRLSQYCLLFPFALAKSNFVPVKNSFTASDFIAREEIISESNCEVHFLPMDVPRKFWLKMTSETFPKSCQQSYARYSKQVHYSISYIKIYYKDADISEILIYDNNRSTPSSGRLKHRLGFFLQKLFQKSRNDLTL